MSRCFPFPPPEYELNGVSGEALLELIKVERERVMAEKERMKKEKRKRKKESEQREISKKKHGHVHNKHKRLRRSNEGEEEQRSESKGKSEQHETQEMERSSLTEELDKQRPISDSPYESSDNSQRRSIRRERYTECHDHEALSCKANCSTGIMDSVVVQKKPELPVDVQESETTDRKESQLRELTKSTQSQKVLCCSLSSSSSSPTSSCSQMCLQQIEPLFTELVVNWLPPPLHFESFGIGDEEWLVRTKQPSCSKIRDTSTAGYDDVFLHQGKC